MERFPGDCKIVAMLISKSLADSLRIFTDNGFTLIIASTIGRLRESIRQGYGSSRLDSSFNA